MEEALLNFDGDELLALARLDLSSNRIEPALAKLKCAVRQEQFPEEVVLELARIYARLGLRDRAKAQFEAFLDKRPDDVTARFQLGMVELENGSLETAGTHWHEVLKQDPAHPPALFYQAFALAKAGKTDVAKVSLEDLLGTIPADNLYFGKAKELLRALDRGEKSAVGGMVPPEAYKTEH